MTLIKLDLDELEKELGEEAQEFVKELANELINQLKLESPTGATSDLQRSWQIFRTGDGEVWLGSRLPYALFVHTGTRPHTPPFEPIQVWARRKLGDESAAGAVWQKIREKGTDPNPYIDRSMENAIDRVTR